MAQDGDAPPLAAKRVGIREFRGKFSGFMRQVRQGSSFLVTSRDEVVAIIQPPSSPPPPQRRPGSLRGRIQIGTDFDLLPTDILAALESERE